MRTPEHSPSAIAGVDRRRLLGAGLAIGGALLAGCASGSSVAERAQRAALAGARPPAPMTDASAGGAKVEVLDFDWFDHARDRMVPVRLFMPQLTTTAPLVVFSHGLGGSRSGYSHLGSYWASHGIATLHPQHAGSDRAVWGSGGLSVISALWAAATPDNAIARVMDVRFVIDQALSNPAWKDRFDIRRIGVAGHSFGANTALLACGARYRESDGRVSSFGDNRIRAAIVMSAPSLPAEQDPVFAYAGIGVPSLHLTGTHDSTPIPGLSTMPEQRRVPFDSMAYGPRYLGIFEGGKHSMFNDWSRDEVSQAIKTETRALTLAFWRSTFQGDGAASTLLREPARQRPSLAALLAAWEAAQV